MSLHDPNRPKAFSRDGAHLGMAMLLSTPVRATVRNAWHRLGLYELK